jgi:hypothetical protein
MERADLFRRRRGARRNGKLIKALRASAAALEEQFCQLDDDIDAVEARSDSIRRDHEIDQLGDRQRSLKLRLRGIERVIEARGLRASDVFDL